MAESRDVAESREPANETQRQGAKLMKRFATLVNPASGLAHDYLNLFNEIVMLIEQAPTMPELMDDLLAWRPISYLDYFGRSQLPGSRSAIEAYNQLRPEFRRQFEDVVEDLDRIATGAVAAIRRHNRVKGSSAPTELAEACARLGAALRVPLARAVELVNGEPSTAENVQKRADRLMAIRRHMTLRGGPTTTRN